MFGKISLKSLTITFFILLLVVMGINYLDHKRGDRSFQSQLAQIDQNDITSVSITTPGADKELSIYKKGEEWRVSNSSEDFLADPDMVSGIIRVFEDLRAERVASYKKESWEKFEVTDSAAIRVRVNSGEKELADVLIGKFSYAMPHKPQMAMQNSYMQGKVTSYVRLTGKREVFAVNGFLKGTFNRNFNDLRSKTVLKGNRSDWTKIMVTHPADSSFTLQKDGVHWMMNGAEADSASLVSFLNSLTSVNGRSFADEKPTGQPIHQMLIEGTGMETPVKIEAYGDVENPVVVSSLNPESYFDANEGDLFNKLFGKRPKRKE